MRVIVVGAGLAGLTAARELERRGCGVTVFEARDRIGGRVWTIREGLGRMHGEAGGELIDEEHAELRRLIRELGLSERRILRSGFAHYRLGGDGRRRIRPATAGWTQMETAIDPFVRRFKLNSEESIGPLAESIASYSVAGWLDELARDGHRKTTREDPEIRELRATATMMRGFFVADPDELSLLTYVEQFNEGGNPARGTIFRLRGGNDQLPERIAKALRKRVRVESCVRRIVQTANSVRVSIQSAGGRHDEMEAEYAIVTAPAPIAAEIEFEPALSDAQATALKRLKYGRATKTLLHFDSHPWRRGKRFRACGTDLDVGAVWDGSEDQRGRNAIITLLAGGSASDGTQKLLATGGPEQLCREIRFFGINGARLLGYRSVTWENDPWARGGYAFFDPSFPPSMRPFLRLPFNRVFFAGEHTSTRWQGYMNGAVESGLRAVEEIFALSGLRYKNSVGSVS